MYKKLLICTADIHWDDEKFKKIEYSFQYFMNYCKNNPSKFIAVAGDYFDKRLSPDSQAYKKAIGYLLELSKYTENLIVIKGTHSHDANQLEILNEVKGLINNIYYFDKFTTKEISGIKFAFIPEEYPENPDEYYKELYSNQYDFIIGHGMLEGSKLHNGIVNRYIKDLKFNHKKLDKLCKYNLWGHIHLPQNLSDKTYYIGSLARWKFGEEEEKRFIVIDENYKLESITTPTYKYLTFTYQEYLELKNEIKNMLEDEKFYIRIIADKDITELEELKKEYPDKLKIIENNKKFGEVVLENQIKYKEIINKNILEQYLHIIENEIKTKNFTKKEKEYLKKENILPLLKEIEKLKS